MTEYQLTIEVKQRGVVLETYKKIVKSNRRPIIGKGAAKLLHPPIYHTIVKVEEIDENIKLS